MNIADGLLHVSERLEGLSETPLLDAQVLLANLLGRNRSWLLAHPEQDLNSEQKMALMRFVERLESGEALPYLLGRWEFYGLEFEVSPATLIPRPETELLVDRALAWLRAHPNQRRAMDVGTGSGCIAVSLAVHVPDLCVFATDISYPALKIAQKNAKNHQVAQDIHLLQADLLSSFPVLYNDMHQIDLLCANLPYIQTDVLAALTVSRKEPWGALDGGEDGLRWIRQLLRASPGLLSPISLLLIEMEAWQGMDVLGIAQEYYPDALIQVLPDLAGRDRMLVVEQGK